MDREPTAYEQLYLIPGAPIEVVEAAAEALRKLHYTRDGAASVERMKQIEKAYREIRHSRGLHGANEEWKSRVKGAIADFERKQARNDVTLKSIRALHKTEEDR